MATEEKKAGKAKAGGGEKRRLSYLKSRSKELKTEMQAVRKEMTELREKLGAGKKGDGAEETDD